jgi:hypothetical protein
MTMCARKMSVAQSKMISEANFQNIISSRYIFKVTNIGLKVGGLVLL